MESHLDNSSVYNCVNKLAFVNINVLHANVAYLQTNNKMKRPYIRKTNVSAQYSLYILNLSPMILKMWKNQHLYEYFHIL